MECPCCYDEMIYINLGNWKCTNRNCGAAMIDLAINGLHYFSDGRVHKKVGNRCRISITI